MIEYRKLPRGDEKIGTLGLGAGSMQETSPAEIQKIIVKAIENGINFFDLCAGGGSVYEPFGNAIQGARDKIYFQLHFGAVYDENGEYGWSRNLDEIKSTFDREMKLLKTDYIDFGFMHCVDEDEDYEEIKENGILAFMRELKKQGVIRHIGFSSHTPSVANKVLDDGETDMMMFSINPAYDLEQGDDLGIGSVSERAELFRRCERDGIGISVMKPFHGGKLLSAKSSPFKTALTKNQCLKYALDRPAVLAAVPGVRTLKDLDELLTFKNSTAEDDDYSVIAKFTPEKAYGSCVYCNHCLPCPAGIDIGLVNKYYDLALVGDKLAENHYDKLTVKADECLNCGHCDTRCPFKVHQSEKMQKINEYFKGV